MIPQLISKAAAQGYIPDAIVCADEVPSGRPAPFMALEALKLLNVSPVWASVKVGVKDIIIHSFLQPSYAWHH